MRLKCFIRLDYSHIFELVDRKRAYISKEKYELLKINLLCTIA